MTSLLPGVGVALPVDDGVGAPELLDLAVEAEELGFGAVMAGEVRGPDVFALLAAIAARTERVRIGTAVVGVRTRSVVSTAMGFGTVSALAPGRVLAGIGVSSRQIIERWHGQSFGSPLRQVADGVPKLKALLAGEQVELEGGGTLRLPEAVPAPVPVLVGALNSRMRQLAGQVADGVVLAWADVDETAEAIAEVRAAAAEAGRSADQLTVAAAVFAYAGDDHDEARADIVERIVRYSLSSGHRNRMRRHLPEVDEVARLWAAGDRAGARALVTAEAIDAYSVVGAGADVAHRMRHLRDVGVDIPLIYPLAASREKAAAGTLKAVAAELEAL